jgi:hypothetical protein
MKDLDRYHKWVEWNEEDQVYIGKCPDLITGIHGDDPVSLYGELCSVVEDVMALWDFISKYSIIKTTCYRLQH